MVTQECTELTPYPRVHVTLVTRTRAKKYSVFMVRTVNSLHGPHGLQPAWSAFWGVRYVHNDLECFIKQAGLYQQSYGISLF